MLPELVPSEFHLGQNYPNPFSEKTRIKYCIPQKCLVVISIHDKYGRLIAKLVEEPQPGGTHEVCWNPGDMPAGVYLCRMKAGTFESTKRMVLEMSTRHARASS